MKRVLVLTMVLAACTPDNPPAGKCDGVRCTGTATCDVTTGLCVGGVDAGAQDAGVVRVDAGAPDAGRDAGVVDAGFDAGAVDAGVDAGLMVDAGAPTGCASDDDCLGVAAHCEVLSGRCFECLEDAHCPSAAPKCNVTLNTCAVCLSNADCANPSPWCDPVSEQCSGCMRDLNCAAGQACDPSTFSCLALPDACGTEKALNLPMSGGGTSFSVNLSQATNDLSVPCNASGGPELVYRFTLTGPREVTISATPQAGATVRPVLWLRQADCSTGASLGCDAPTTGAASLAASLTAGDYFLFVESAGGTGLATVSVNAVAMVTPPANDTCTAPEPLVFVGTRASVAANTLAATNDATAQPSSCSAASRTVGRDLVYSYELTVPSQVTVSVRALNGSLMKPVLSVRNSCDQTANELDCVASTAGESVALSFSRQTAGTYFVWVDSADGATGSFQLDVTVVPVLGNDVCSQAQNLPFTNDRATATSDTTFAVNDNGATDPSPSCSPSAKSTPDLVYAYTLTQAQDVTINVTPTGASPTYQPVVYVRRACGDVTSANELACVNSAVTSTARLSLVNQPVGTYFVWVDGVGSTGPFQLEIVRSAPTPPPANDTCSTAMPLVFTGNVATLSGSTAQAANDNNAFDVSPTCSAGARQNGRDVVYAFTLASAQDVAIEVSAAAGSTLRPVVYVRKGTCASQLVGDELVCLERLTSAQTTLTNLSPGAYWLFVDGTAGSSGAFTMTVTKRPPTPPPSNDGCEGQLLSFDGGVALVAGTTVGASNSNDAADLTPSCSDTRIAQRWGRDVVYRVVLTEPHDLDIRVAATAGSPLVPVTYLREPGLCSSFSIGSERACGTATNGTASVYVPNVPAGAYALFVDGDSHEPGAFNLSVTQRPPTPVPTNDTCAQPTALMSGATLSGVTLSADDTFSDLSLNAACRGQPFTGRDVVYQVTATTTGPLTVTVTPSGSFDPAVLLLVDSCDPMSCVRAVNASGSGASESVTFSATAGRSYFLIVDSAWGTRVGSSGAFTITVQ